MARTQRLASIDDRRLDVFSRLTNHQLRNRLDEKNAVLVAESRTVVEVALECGVEPLAFLVEVAGRPFAPSCLCRCRHGRAAAQGGTKQGNHCPSHSLFSFSFASNRATPCRIDSKPKSSGQRRLKGMKKASATSSIAA